MTYYAVYHMNYLSEVDEFVLTSDPLIHIIKNLSDKDLYNLKYVNKFYSNNKKISEEIELKNSLRIPLIIKMFGVENMVKNRQSSIPNDYSFYFKILMQMTYETLTNIKLDIDMHVENLQKMCTYMQIYIYGSEKYFIEVGTYHSWFTGPQQKHIKIYINDQTTTIEIDENNIRENMTKLRNVFMEINNDNIIETFKKYYT